MESFEDDPFVTEEMHDDELSAVLQRWQVPPMPRGLRRAVLPEPSGAWWKRMWVTSIRVPVPLAVALLLLLVIASWREGGSHVWLTPSGGGIRGGTVNSRSQSALPKDAPAKEIEVREAPNLSVDQFLFAGQQGKEGFQMAYGNANVRTPSSALPSKPKRASIWRLVTDLRPRVIPARNTANSDDKN